MPQTHSSEASVQDRPTAEELLSTIADLLEGDVLTATHGALKHQVRVAGNLCRILEREVGQRDANAEREVALLAAVLGVDPAEHDAEALNRRLAERLAGEPDLELEQRAWPALLEIIRGKLAIDKPGHDAYDFSAELES